MNSWDVVIVGAGPAGSAAATLLARNGRRVLLLEKSTFPRDKICGDCVNPRCWDYFERLGVAGMVLRSPHRPIDRIKISTRSGRQISYEAGLPSRPFVAIRRSVLDSILLQHARQAGAEVIFQSQFIHASYHGGWSIKAQREKETTLHSADILIGADGRNSAVATALQKGPDANELGFVRKNRRVGIQWHVSNLDAMADAVWMFIVDGGYGGIVNIDETTANIAMVVQPGLAQLAKEDHNAFLEATLCRHQAFRQWKGALNPRGNILTASPINPLCRTIPHPRAFLIGDARRTVEPFTGEGILLALLDGFRVASEICGIVDHPFPVGHPSTFVANRLFSPLLRHPLAAEISLGIGSAFPPLGRALLQKILAGNLPGMHM